MHLRFNVLMLVALFLFLIYDAPMYTQWRIVIHILKNITICIVLSPQMNV